MNINSRNLLLSFLLGICLLNCSSGLKNFSGISHKSKNQADTLEGYFFYEANIPEKCYARLDQIEQGCNLIYFDSLIGKKEVEQLYKNGVFIFNFQPLMQPYIKNYKLVALQNKEALNIFFKAANYTFHWDDSLYNKTLYYDSKKVLSYKKIYAKLIVSSLGKQKQLVPDMANYKCCYSNVIEELPTFFIVNIFDFKIY